MKNNFKRVEKKDLKWKREAHYPGIKKQDLKRKAGKEYLEKDNFIQHKKYTTKITEQRIQHIYTTQKIQHGNYNAENTTPENRKVWRNQK